MTTIIDPTGTPTIVYNRSGTTIVSLVGGFTPINTPGSPNGNAGVDIPRLSETTIALITTNTVHDAGGVNISGRNEVVRLPIADIGDVVEIYLVSADNQSGGPAVFPQIGEQVLSIGEPGGAISDGTNPSAMSFISTGRFRKVSSTIWVAIS
jgi:hypothetical protein